MQGIAPKRKFGQNFLTDKTVVERIVSTAGDLENKCIIEIGGGSGVIKDIPDNSKVMGYPAKNIRNFIKENR